MRGKGARKSRKGLGSLFAPESLSPSLCGLCQGLKTRECVVRRVQAVAGGMLCETHTHLALPSPPGTF